MFGFEGMGKANKNAKALFEKIKSFLYTIYWCRIFFCGIFIRFSIKKSEYACRCAFPCCYHVQGCFFVQRIVCNKGANVWSMGLIDKITYKEALIE